MTNVGPKDRKLRKIRVLSSQDLADINAEALARGYNRALVPEFFQALDPAGLHVVFLEFPHERHDGEWRWQIMAKVKDTMEPVTVQLDVAPELINRGRLWNPTTKAYEKDYPEDHIYNLAPEVREMDEASARKRKEG